MNERTIDRLRAQSEEVCAELDRIETGIDETPSYLKRSYLTELLELRQRCEALEVRIRDVASSDASGAGAWTNLLAVAGAATSRIEKLIVATEDTRPHEDHDIDEVCVDEQDDPEDRDPGALPGSVLGVGGATAGLTPLSELPESEEP